MGFLDVLVNSFKAAMGKDQEFLQLLASKDITRAQDQMTDNTLAVLSNIREYDTDTHEIMFRPKKEIFDKNGNHVRWQDQWKLPIPYPPYINEIALVMLFGRPVKWKQKSQNTDNAYKAFLNLIKSTRFDSRIRQAKRLAGKEGESAILFHCYQDSNEKPNMLLKVLAKSLGDDIRYIKDQYGRLVAVGWGYYLKEGDNTVYHFDIFTSKVTYLCKKSSLGWEVIPKDNPIGKIQILLFQQNVEHKGVENLIKREEWVGSTTADVNDYFASPAVKASADILEALPEKQEVGKLYTLQGEGSDVSYLTWDAAPEAKEKEIDWLQQHILSKTFTPKIDWESMKGLSNISGKALEQLFLPATIKAEKNKEVYGEMMDRATNLFISAIANVLDISLKSECDNLIISHEFQKPFAEDITEAVERLAKAYESGGLSQESFVELNPLVEDNVIEMNRIRKEQGEKAERNRMSDMFETSY